MSHCQAQDRKSARCNGELVIALAGNPNAGKTTIFNALTGLRQKVANYPGVTVEKKIGWFTLVNGKKIQVIDLPGTYSLISRSPDERVAMEILRGLNAGAVEPPDVVVVVIDASNLQRNLYLVSQLIELGKPLVVALNMVDVARRRGVNVSASDLERELGVPVVPVIGHRMQGINRLKRKISDARVAPMPDWRLPEGMKRELALVGDALAALRCERADCSPMLAERLLIGDSASDICKLHDHPLIKSLVLDAQERMTQLGIDPVQADIEAHYQWIESVASRSMSETAALRPLSDHVDAILVHKVWGLLIFAAIMGSLFVALFWVAQPMMDGMQNGIGWLGVALASRLSAGPVHDLLKDGIFGGVGTVLAFVPQIALLFIFLTILEDSGYLVRAAFLMDRLLAKVGLNGKSFIPLLSSFACAIPGILTTRTIENRKDRLATILIAPFMSCSARLPVYTLLIGTFFAGYGANVQAGTMLVMYAVGVIAAAATAWIFRRTLLKGPAQSFILEFPAYKIPQLMTVLRQSWSNTAEFVKKAGTIVFCFSVVLWAMTYYGPPKQRLAEMEAAGEPANVIAAERMNSSIAGRFGHLVEPSLRPLGFDWKIDVGLVGAFAAREVFISTMGIVYSAGNVDQGGTAQLSHAMRADQYADGRPVWTPLVAVSLLIWFVLAMQCMSTLAVVRRETGTWIWPIFMVIYMNALAYVACLLIYQVGQWW